MPRTKIEIDKNELVAAIKAVESCNKFSTRNELGEAVAAEMGLGVSPATIALRIKEFNLEDVVQTPKGKRGRQAGVKLTTEQKQAMQAGRKKKTVGNIAELRKNFPESRQGLLNKVENGSLAAAVKAKCLECVQFQTVEIKHCQCFACPLHAFRPYQEK